MVCSQSNCCRVSSNQLVPEAEGYESHSSCRIHEVPLCEEGLLLGACCVTHAALGCTGFSGVLVRIGPCTFSGEKNRDPSSQLAAGQLQAAFVVCCLYFLLFICLSYNGK